jgi:glutathione S-transferase-like protein
MLTVHHLNNSRSQRIVWLCEELGLDYKLVKHQRNPETQRSPDSLNKVHPLGKAPTIDHDGKIIVESEAIIEYVCNKLAGGQLSRGVKSPEYGEYLEWLAFPEGTLFPGLAVDLVYAWTGGGNDTLMGFFEAELRRTISTSRTGWPGAITCSTPASPPPISTSAGDWRCPRLAAACGRVPRCRITWGVCVIALATSARSKSEARRI